MDQQGSRKFLKGDALQPLSLTHLFSQWHNKDYLDEGDVLIWRAHSDVRTVEKSHGLQPDVNVDCEKRGTFVCYTTVGQTC